MNTRKQHQTILIANRSEIAVRIIATCKMRGFETVAVYCPEDTCAPHVYKADQAFALYGSGTQAYLDQEQIIQVALQAGATAVHPGYGFLAENAQFAQAVIDAGLIWIGPSPKHILLMADKNKAREAMIEASVPVFPGAYVNGDKPECFEKIKQAAHAIGYPVVLKSALGGGGRAMRAVENDKELAACWPIILSESRKFFNTAEFIIEKYVQHGRHVEVQIAGDGTDVVHIFERECSIQRRHQKVVEETPCTFITEQTRQKLFQAACTAAQAISYENIGTVEFLVSPDQSFYFLEMNTRLQVEHPVTEMTTGIDLVDLQLTLAFERKLPLTQATITQRGHALECRIYSEDPDNNFTPSSGKITTLQFPSTPFARYDHALENGSTIAPLFDPMIAKATTVASTREQAINYMTHALANMHIGGVTTNIAFLQEILSSRDFVDGSFCTQWLNEHVRQKETTHKETNKNLPTHEGQPYHFAAAALVTQESQTTTTNPEQPKSSSAWRGQRWS